MLYGAFGNVTCLYYNINVATSITTQGKSCISAAVLQFEMFLANNVKFRSLNEVITFIDNVVNEERHYDDSVILDENVTIQEAYYKIMTTCGFEYIPTEKDMFIVWEIIGRLKQEDWNRLYYKNNLYSFIDNKSMSNAVVYMLQKLNKPFLDPNKVPKEISVEMETFLDIMKEYVYYSHQIIDRIGRAENMIRSVVAITDTDSVICSLDAWYRYMLEKVWNKPMKIKTEFIKPISFVNADEFGDPDKLEVVEFLDQEYDYDFFTDEVIEMQKSINPLQIIPQEGLRYSIINILAYSLYILVNDYMMKYTMNSNSYTPDKKCLLILKNEFLFQRVMMTDAKKNYATIQELQEGNIVGSKLDTKGLPMTKSTLNPTTQDKLQEILYEDILKCKEIDQIRVLKKIAIFEKEIYNSLLSKKKDFYKPLSIKSIGKYDDPMRIQGIKASIVWNTLKYEGVEGIDLEERNNIDVVKVLITPKNVDKVKDLYPDIHSKLLVLMKQKEFNTGITALAVPRDAEAPDWVLEFIDYTTIINDNIKTFPLDSISLYRMNDNNNYSNILSL